MNLTTDFNLTNKKVKFIKGEHKGKIGTIKEITGYTTGYGVVALIELENGKEVEYSADFWEEV